MSEGETIDELGTSRAIRGHDIESIEDEDVQSTPDAGDEVLEISEATWQSQATTQQSRGSKRQRQILSDSDSDRNIHTRHRQRALSTVSTAPSIADTSEAVSLSLPALKKGNHGAEDIHEFFEKGSVKGNDIVKTVCKRCR
jgi:hypothetical protein